jgi:murein DD-endopeptidase MepM/ murein hydrolase activator NlpD
MKKRVLFLFFIAGLLTVWAGFQLVSHFWPRQKMAEVVNFVRKPADKILYGLNLTDYILKEHVVQKNEVLAGIFTAYAVPVQVADLIVQQSLQVFNPHRITAGNSILLACEKVGNQEIPRKAIYEVNPEEYVVFNLEDSLFVYKGRKEVKQLRREIAGEIKSSLYETLEDLDVSPGMAVVLADVFKWTVDFHRIQQGDGFKVIFDEQRVEGQPIGVGEIHACVFRHKGKDFYAFAYKTNDGKTAFYDEQGNTLRKMFLQAPVKFSRISSRFSKRRFHPVTGRWKAHLGTDYAAPHGTPIVATADGVVSEARFRQYNGNYVKIRHDGTYETQYLHMSRIAKGMRPGKRVSQGEVIGYVGSTGLATGPHVCYRFWKKGQQVDALRENQRAATPLPAAEKQTYLQSIASLHTAIIRLDSRQMKQRESAQRIKAALQRNCYRAALLGQPEID